MQPVLPSGFVFSFKVLSYRKFETTAKFNIKSAGIVRYQSYCYFF